MTDKHLVEGKAKIKYAFDQGYLTGGDLNDALGLGMINKQTYEKYHEKLRNQALFENKG